MSVKIAMVGTGYVGLVTGACFAELGHDVICVDTDQDKINMINRGELPIYEPGLEELVAHNLSQGRLRFSTDTTASVKDREAVFLAVGTPSEGGSGRADLKYVFNAAVEVAKAIDDFTVIVTKSTVPVGTNRRVFEKVSDHLGGSTNLAVASNPEFLREGAAIRDFMEPDRIVIGSDDPRAVELMTRIYEPLTSREVPLMSTSIETAEMIKYAANAFLAVKVSYINEIADLCEVVGADVGDVATGIGLDHRIGSTFLSPGPGWGGSCFPKDTRALSTTAKEASIPLRVVDAAIDANDVRKAGMAERVRLLCGNALEGKRVAVLGVTFKGQTDDMRESPSLDIIPKLEADGAEVAAFDPSHPKQAPQLLPQTIMTESALAAAEGADILVVLTDWITFKTLPLADIAAVMRRPVMLDLRNLFSRERVLSSGFSAYAGLGQDNQFDALVEPGADARATAGRVRNS